MTKEEAIERIKARFNNWVLDDNDIDAIKELIPDLKESKDERIRKALIHSINEHDGFLTAIDGISVRDIITYLENQPTNEEMLRTLRAEYEKGVADTIAKYEQKEQKHKFKVGDRVTNGECVYTIDKIGKNCYWVKEHDCATIPFEYEDTWSIEQKPAEWSEEDENAITTAIRACRYMIENFENSTKQYEDAIERLKSLPERFNPKPKQEWSEEDKQILNAAIDMVEKGDIFFTFENNKYKVSDWLKLLPERFNTRNEE